MMAYWKEGLCGYAPAISKLLFNRDSSSNRNLYSLPYASICKFFNSFIFSEEREGGTPSLKIFVEVEVKSGI